MTPATVTEDGVANIVYTLFRTGPTTSALSVNYTVGGTATLGTDYAGIAAAGATKTVTFAAGSGTALVTVNPTADTTFEANETISLTLAAGTGYTIGTTTPIIGTITNDDVALPSITLTASLGSVAEDGVADLVYTFTRTGPTTSALSVNYTVAGTATLGTDYIGIAAAGATKAVSFAAGSATAVVTVNPIADTAAEANETVALTLAAGSGYTVGTTTAVTGTITNDDLPRVTLAVTPASVTEDGATNLVYTFTRTGPTTSALSVNYSVGGTATIGTDYTGITAAGTTKTVSFTAGASTAVVTVNPTADTTAEANETVALTLAAGSGYTVGTTTAVTGTITNDDLPRVTLVVTPASVTEDGATNLVYTFTRTGPTTSAMSVNYSVGGTASLGADYTGIAAVGTTKTVTFSAGSATALVTVDPTADTAVETNETVALTLTAGTGYTVGTTTAVTGAISNDDLPRITLAVAPATVTEDGAANLVYTFTRTGPTTGALIVSYSIGGTATLGTDYAGIATASATKTVTFAAGSATAVVTVNPTADIIVEANETVALTLAAGTGYTVGTTTAVTGTITNDDNLNLVPKTNITANGSALSDTSHPTNRIQLLSVDQGFGSAWWNQSIDLSKDWTTTFRVNTFGGSGTSDGFTFAINADSRGPNSLGDGGQNLGFFGFDSKAGVRRSYAIIFDMWNTQPTSLLGFSGSRTDIIPQGTSPLPLSLSNNAYDVQIGYNASQARLSVIIGGQEFIQSVNLDSTVGRTGFLGFTAANGGGTMDTDIISWNVLASPLDRPSITLAVAPASVTEDGVTNLVYTFTRTGPTTSALSVNYSVGGTATLGTDYTGITAAGTTKTVTFAAGSATALVTVDPTADATAEVNETVALTLAAGSGYTVATTTAVTGTITNDDIQSAVSATLIDAQSSLTLTGTSRINGAGNALNNTIVGNASNNRLVGGLGRDVLTGGGTTDNDTFVYNALNESILSGYDVITDYTGRDRFFAPLNVQTATLDSSAGNVLSLTDTAISTLLAPAAFAANSAAAFTATGQAGTFLALNDSRAGFQADTDSIVFLRGFTFSQTNYVDLI